MVCTEYQTRERVCPLIRACIIWPLPYYYSCSASIKSDNKIDKIKQNECPVPPNILRGPSGEIFFWISFENGSLWCTLYFWATAGPPNVAEPGVTNPLFTSPTSRRACALLGLIDRTDTHGWLLGWCLPGLWSGHVRWVPSLFLSCLGVGCRVGETLAVLRDDGLD